MRTRAFAVVAAILTVVFVAALISTQPGARAFQTDGSPEATPVDEATPVTSDQNELVDESGILTLVFWYRQNSTGEILHLSPIDYEDFVATRAEPANDSEEGRIVFEESRNDGYPRIRVGEDNYFDAYPVYPDDPNTALRWLFFDDDPELRPATMVMQLVGIAGDYEDWTGTATFISRGTEQGGVMILAIRPPAEE